MAQLVGLPRGLPRRASLNKELWDRSFGKALVIMTLVCVLSLGLTALAQPRSARSAGKQGEQVPPRPQQSYRPGPWFLAFVLLGLAWYPAFKNSKRELTE